MSARYDVAVVGSGPAGQKAAIQAAKAGRRVAVIEKQSSAGGACVHFGTIPSKTLRETTLAWNAFRRKTRETVDLKLPENTKVAALMAHLDAVIRGHQAYIGDQLRRNGIDYVQGIARFKDPHTLAVRRIDGGLEEVGAGIVILAPGSRPRTPPEVPVDHEHILDSDSILSLIYLPASLTVLGAGVIACEYASIFAALGVKVTIVDKGPLPLGFLDPEISRRYLAGFEALGGTFKGNAKHEQAEFDGLEVSLRLANGEDVRAEKLLCTLGRVACLDGLNLEAAGLCSTDRYIAVNEHFQTQVPHIYAAGDVIGPPALAASSMEQGRRAACHALGLPAGERSALTPVGIYAIPEVASVGLSEPEAIKQFGGCMVGRARFAELARGHIAGITDGLLKIVADAAGRKLLGVQIVGEGAAELIHLGQMGLIHGCDVDLFIDYVFNFPTLAEAYRVAAFDLIEQRQARAVGSVAAGA
ncbi:MAG: Si-specific NAD(P)(+) transhydrogenase [Planctomycetota bacterium]|nr:Si-specific NAD(P)(+) transhydrogenase [Planctomycetota bacterium]